MREDIEIRGERKSDAKEKEDKLISSISCYS